MKSLVDQLLHARTGPMTAELVRRPSEFGLGQLPVRLTPVSTTRSVCGYCSTGCQLSIHRDANGAAINLSPERDYPVNLGMACPKGWEALTPLASPDRGTTPLLRHPLTGKLEPIDWSRALDTFVTRFRDIGMAQTAFFSTGQVPTEEMALLGALFKFGMGGIHADSNTRQCMATAHVAYKQSFGFDAPPYTYADFEAGDVLIFVGANLAIAHPIMWQRVVNNRNDPEIIVIDPRRTETAMCASAHIAIQPRGDLWFFFGVARALVDAEAVDRAFLAAHTNGFDDFVAFLRDYPVDRCAKESGVAEDSIRNLAATIARGRAVSFWWTMGVNQGHESTRTAQAIINLCLLTGNIGRPGTGANSITGQCNAMGSRLFANATSLLGGRSFTDPDHRAEVARILEIPESRIPNQDSWAYDQIIDGIDAGSIRGLWVIATNPAHSWINHGRLRELRDKLEFLVVQDMYSSTETAQWADLYLPAAGWGEKDGTFINSERRLGVTRKVAPAPGEALSDFAIFRLIAEAWGCGSMFERWSSPEAVFEILKELSRGQPCDITGIRDYAHLDESGGIQWPYPIGTDATAPEQRLFTDSRFFTPDQRANILFEAPRTAPEKPDDAFPFWLNTGRGSSAQWHTGTRTNKSDVLRKLAPRAVYAEIHPDDAARLGIANGSTVRVESRRGSMPATALCTTTVLRGQIFIPMHFAQVNQLTFPAFDSQSRQPSYKACAVKIERHDQPLNS